MATNEKLQQMIAQARKKSEEANPKKSATAPAQKTAPVHEEQVEQVEEKNYDLENNTFAKIMFSKKLTAEEKKAAFVEAMTHDDTKTAEENKRLQKELDLFKEYLQYERRRMAQDIITLANTDAFAQMHDMVNDMSGAITDYDKKMQPLSDIIDAIWKLRQEGKDMTLKVYQELQNDKEFQAKRDKEIADKTAEIEALERKNIDDTARIETLNKKKSFFGLGRGAVAEAQQEAARLGAEKVQRLEEIKAKKQELESLNTAPLETKFKGFEKEKEQLRILLNISSDEWKTRQQELSDAANHFINTAAARGADVQALLEDVGEQIDTLNEANRGVQSIYGLLTEASTEASKANKAKRDRYKTPGENESRVQQSVRETKLAAIEDFIAVSEISARDTAKSFSDLAVQGNRITSMKGANMEQRQNARELTTSGIAGVAENLSVALTTISAAALNESTEHARDALKIMNEKTDMQNQQEALRQAAGYTDLAAVMNEQAEKLMATKEVSKAATEIKQKGLEALKDSMGTVMELANQVLESNAEQRGVDAEVGVAESLGGGFNEKAAKNEEANDNTPAAKEEKPTKKPQRKRAGTPRTPGNES